MILSFHDLPDDILLEVLSNLSALSILSCRKVCRRLNGLSRAHHVWMIAFNRTLHMLYGPTMDILQISLSQLETIMTRAEKLNQLWSDGEALSMARPRLYRFHNTSRREPLTVIGDYIVFRELWRKKWYYQWISKHNVVGEQVVLEHAIPDGMAEASHVIDHASGIFYMIFCSRSTKEPIQVVEIQLDTEHRRPHISTCSQITLEGDRSIEYMKTTDHCVCLYIYNPDYDLQLSSTFVDILDLRSRAVSQFIQLSHPPSFPEYPASRTIHISEYYIILVVDWMYFSVFHRQNPEGEVISALAFPEHLGVYFSGTFPSGFRNGGCLIPTASLTIIGFAEDDIPFQSPSKIYLLSVEDPRVEDSITQEFIEMIGSTRGQTFIIPPSRQTHYTLGMASTRNYMFTNGKWKAKYNHFYAFRFEVFGPERTLTVDSMKAIKMDLTHWLNEDENDMCVIDFDPFSGIGLLAGPPGPEIGPGHQSILVLDYLGRN